MVERNMQKSKIKIIDNFLPIHKFNTIKKDLESENFPWYSFMVGCPIFSKIEAGIFFLVIS